MHPKTAEAARTRTRSATARRQRSRRVLWPLHSHALPLIAEDDAVFVDALDDDLTVERLALDELSSAEEDHAVPRIGRPHQHFELELRHRVAELGAGVGFRLRDRKSTRLNSSHGYIS